MIIALRILIASVDIIAIYCIYKISGAQYFCPRFSYPASVLRVEIKIRLSSTIPSVIEVFTQYFCKGGSLRIGSTGGKAGLGYSSISIVGISQILRACLKSHDLVAFR